MGDGPKIAGFGAIGAERATPVGTVNGVVPRCPICGNQHWARKIPEGLDAREDFTEILAALNGPKLFSLPVVNFVCTTCGYVRSHDKEFWRP